MSAESLIGLAAGTLVILGTLLIVSGAFTGIGLLIRRAFRAATEDIDDCFLAFWTGFGMVIFLLIIWNFFLPVGLAALVVVLSLGGLGWWFEGVPVRILRKGTWRPRALQALLLAVGALWIANHSMPSFQGWDDGLYHAQGVQWAETYPVVRGIANLHGPLAFNNSSFLYDAMLDSGWWKGRGFHVANGVFVLVVVLQAIISGARSVKGGPQASNVRIFRFLLLAPAIYIAQNGNLAGYSTDVPANLIVLAASALLYEFLDDEAPHNSRANAHTLISLSILFAAAVCIKMSSAVFAAVAMPVAVYFWWKRRDRKGGAAPIAIVTLITLCFAVAWITRGILMSGYPLFPLSLAGLPVEWRAPIEHVQAEYAYIGFTEREFTWRFIGRNWLRQVFLNDIYSVFIPACLTAVAVAASIFSRKIRSRLRETPRDTWWFLVPVLAAIAGWTFSAPSLRYGLALFWALAAWSICECLRALRVHLGTQAWRQVAMGLALLGVSPLLVAPMLAAILHGDNVLASVLRYNIIEPETDHWLPAIGQNPNVVEYTTRSGLGLNVPKKTQGDRAFAKCWNAPLPCTPNPAPNLQLIEPGRLEKGFKVAGGWQMEDWPAYWQDQYLREWRSRRAGTRTHTDQ